MDVGAYMLVSRGTSEVDSSPATCGCITPYLLILTDFPDLRMDQLRLQTSISYHISGNLVP